MSRIYVLYIHAGISTYIPTYIHILGAQLYIKYVHAGTRCTLHKWVGMYVPICSTSPIKYWSWISAKIQAADVFGPELLKKNEKLFRRTQNRTPEISHFVCQSYNRNGSHSSCKSQGVSHNQHNLVVHRNHYAKDLWRVLGKPEGRYSLSKAIT